MRVIALLPGVFRRRTGLLAEALLQPIHGVSSFFFWSATSIIFPPA
jgi:hypothetical protein